MFSRSVQCSVAITWQLVAGGLQLVSSIQTINNQYSTSSIQNPKSLYKHETSKYSKEIKKIPQRGNMFVARSVFMQMNNGASVFGCLK